MNNSQKISISSEQEQTLPLTAMLICAKVQKKISHHQIRVILEACRISDNIKPSWVFSSANSSLQKIDLDFFMSSYVMQTNESVKRQMIAWAIRFVRVSEDALSIKSSMAILFKMIDLLLPSNKNTRLKINLLRKYPDYKQDELEILLVKIIDQISQAEQIQQIDKKVEKDAKNNVVFAKMGKNWLKKFLSGFQIELPKNHANEDPKKFTQYLSGSLSLNEKEKQRVIDQYGVLSEFQFDELLDVFKGEVAKFASLKKEFPNDIAILEIRCAMEWLNINKKSCSKNKNVRQELAELANIFSLPENKSDEVYICTSCGYSQETNKIRVKKNNHQCPLCEEKTFINENEAVEYQ